MKTPIILIIVMIWDHRQKQNLDGVEKNIKVELIYQNEPFKLKCKCKKEALYIYEGDKLCEECKLLLDENEECFLPIVNSPRVGVCGYEGEQFNYKNIYRFFIQF